MPKAMQWISGQQLMKRWDQDAFELFELISQGMTAYWRRDGNLEKFDPNDYEEFILQIETRLETICLGSRNTIRYRYHRSIKSKCLFPGLEPERYPYCILLILYYMVGICVCYPMDH